MAERGGHRLKAALVRVPWFERDGLPAVTGLECAQKKLCANAGGTAEGLPFVPRFGEEGLFQFYRKKEDALERMERPVSIEALAGNEPALRLYQRCGFQPEKIVSGQCRVTRALQSCATSSAWIALSNLIQTKEL